MRSTASSPHSVIAPEPSLAPGIHIERLTGGSACAAVYDADIDYVVVRFGISSAAFKFAFNLALKQVHIAVHLLRLPYVYVELLTLPPSPCLACRSLSRE